MPREVRLGGNPPSGNDTTSGQPHMSSDSRDDRFCICWGRDLSFLQALIVKVVSFGVRNSLSGNENKLGQPEIIKFAKFG